MQSIPPEQELSSIHAMPLSSNHRLPPSRTVAENSRAAPSPARIDRRWAFVAAVIAATLLALMVYQFFGPIGSDPDNGPVIPAAVVQEVTPIATPVGEHKITIDLPASMVHSTGSINAGWDYIEFPADSTFKYVPYCCPGPFIEYVLDGQLTVQSAAPMTIIRSDDTTELIPAGQDVTISTGDAFLTENEAELLATNPSDSMTQLLGWVLLNDDEFQGHEVGGFPRSLDVDLEFECRLLRDLGSWSSHDMTRSARSRNLGQTATSSSSMRCTTSLEPLWLPATSSTRRAPRSRTTATRASMSWTSS